MWWKMLSLVGVRAVTEKFTGDDPDAGSRHEDWVASRSLAERRIEGRAQSRDDGRQGCLFACNIDLWLTKSCLRWGAVTEAGR